MLWINWPSLCDNSNSWHLGDWDSRPLAQQNFEGWAVASSAERRFGFTAVFRKWRVASVHFWFQTFSFLLISFNIFNFWDFRVAQCCIQEVPNRNLGQYEVGKLYAFGVNNFATIGTFVHEGSDLLLCPAQAYKMYTRWDYMLKELN